MRNLQRYKQWGHDYYIRNKDRIRERHKERLLKLKIPCPKCGQLMSHDSKFCKICALISRGGENASHWKGGRIKDPYGYIYIYAPNHPRANTRPYVYEHILVWEQTHGKPVPRGWIIHHLNGIKDDNRPENLVAVKKKDHSSYTYIRLLQTRIRGLEQLHL